MHILEKIDNYLDEAKETITVIWLDTAGKQNKKTYKTEKDWSKETNQSEDYPKWAELVNMSAKGKIYATTYAFHDEENITADNDIKKIKKVVTKEVKKSKAGGFKREDLDDD